MYVLTATECTIHTCRIVNDGTQHRVNSEISDE